MYFHNVPFEVNEEDLLPLFERAGPVKALRLFTLKAWSSRRFNSRTPGDPRRSRKMLSGTGTGTSKSGPS